MAAVPYTYLPTHFFDVCRRMPFTVVTSLTLVRDFGPSWVRCGMRQRLSETPVLFHLFVSGCSLFWCRWVDPTTGYSVVTGYSCACRLASPAFMEASNTAVDCRRGAFGDQCVVSCDVWYLLGPATNWISKSSSCNLNCC